MLKYRDDLINSENIIQKLNLECIDIKDDNTKFINNLLKSNGVLSNSTPFEIHPYINEMSLNQFEKYIIGTFPPISYILDNTTIANANINYLIQPNKSGRAIQKARIPFYHGNKGSMWDFILSNNENHELNLLLNQENGRIRAKEFLINFLIDNKINYADIIESTQRSLNNKSRYDADDNNLCNISINKDLITHILSNKNATLLLFNTSSIFGNDGIEIENDKTINVTKNTKAFDIFVRGCQDMGLKIEIRVLLGKRETTFEWTNICNLNTQQKRSKTIFEMRISKFRNKSASTNEIFNFDEKILTTITPLSPAAVKRGKTKMNLIIKNWMNLNPSQNADNFLKLAYHSFRNNDINYLYSLNR